MFKCHRMTAGGLAKWRRQPRSVRPGISVPFLEALETRFLPSATFYVSPSGNDSYNGTSPQTAWRTTAKVNSHVFEPGDTIRFEGGASFSGGLSFNSADAGTPSNPITVTSYGTGRATILSGTAAGFIAADTAGFNVTELRFVGAGGSVNPNNGILFSNSLPGNSLLDHVHIDNVEVSGYGYIGIWVVSENGTSGYRDVRVTNCDVHNVLQSGVVVGTAAFYTRTMHDVYIGHVKAHNIAGFPASQSGSSGSGIIVFNTDGGVIERCLAHDNGNPGVGDVGIWSAISNDITIQFNESYHNHTGGSPMQDGDGFDFDGGVTNSVMQYNYSHDNDGAGFLEYQPPGFPAAWSGNTVRYNISENDSRKANGGYSSFFLGGETNHLEVYNNTVFLTPGAGSPRSAMEVGGFSGTGLHVRNNIFEVTGGIPVIIVADVTGTDLLFQGNDYFSACGRLQIIDGQTTYTSLAAWRAASGQEKLNGNAVGYSVDPQLNDPGGGGTIGDADLLSSLSAYQLKSTSPLREAGLNLLQLFGIHPGTRDFYGNSLSADDDFSIGAFQG